jgi:phosphomannomutase
VKKNSFTKIIKNVKEELEAEGEEVSQVELDLRFGEDNKWFVLIHPSNTEHVIRVICEAKRESLARIRCETTAELIRMKISEIYN